MIQIFSYVKFFGIVRIVAVIFLCCLVLVASGCGYAVYCSNVEISLRNQIEAQQQLVVLLRERRTEEIGVEENKLLVLQCDHKNLLTMFPSCLVVGKRPVIEIRVNNDHSNSK